MITAQDITTISDLRFKTLDVLKRASRRPLFLFHRSTPKGVLLSMEAYEKLMSIMEDYYDSLKAQEYESEAKKNISWATLEEVQEKIDA